MFSTLLELVGFAAIVAATWLLGGLPAGLYAVGVCALIVGYSTDDPKAVVALSRAVAPVRWASGTVSEWRDRRKQRRRDLAKAA